MKLSKEVRDAFKKLGKMGGKARSASLTPERRNAIAKQASAARWAKYRAERAEKMA